MATYTPNIPQPSDIPAVSQGQILQNFQSIDDGTNGFALNHVSLTNATVGQRGKHNMMQMPEQTIVPITAVNEGALYTKDDGTRTSLYWRQENNGTEIKITGLDPLSATPGYTFLPGGLLIQWGTVTAFNSGGTVTWPIAFTTFFSATLSRREDAGNNRGFVQFDAVSGPSNTGAVVRVRDSNGNQINNQTIYFIAIGSKT